MVSPLSSLLKLGLEGCECFGKANQIEQNGGFKGLSPLMQVHRIGRTESVKKRKRGALEKDAQAKCRQSVQEPKPFTQNTCIGRTESVKKRKRGALEKGVQAKCRQSVQEPKPFTQNTRIGRTKSVKK